MRDESEAVEQAEQSIRPDEQQKGHEVTAEEVSARAAALSKALQAEAESEFVHYKPDILGVLIHLCRANLSVSFEQWQYWIRER